MKLKKRQGLTAEEVSGLLGVSIPTVIRHFKKGILTGWENPTTGKRLIDPDSVEAFVALKWKRADTIRQAVEDFAGRRHR